MTREAVVGVQTQTIQPPSPVPISHLPRSQLKQHLFKDTPEALLKWLSSTHPPASTLLPGTARIPPWERCAPVRHHPRTHMPTTAGRTHAYSTAGDRAKATSSKRRKPGDEENVATAQSHTAPLKQDHGSHVAQSPTNDLLVFSSSIRILSSGSNCS